MVIVLATLSPLSEEEEDGGGVEKRSVTPPSLHMLLWALGLLLHRLAWLLALPLSLTSCGGEDAAAYRC